MFNMKPVQVMLDERLLEELDAAPEVARDGRSAVIRRAIADYLSRARRAEIRERYESAYGAGAEPAADLEGWADEGEWPDV